MNPIEALMDNDPAKFKDSVQDMLMQKLGDRLDLERINMAQSMFGESPDTDEEDRGDFEPEFDEEEFNDDSFEYETFVDDEE